MTNKFIPWPEDPTPNNEQHCKRCGLYTHGSRMIWGEGNPSAHIMLILDNPGEREDREGKEYVCGTRQTLHKAAYDVGLNQDDLYVTYILKRRPKRAYDKPKTRSICIEHLYEQIDNKQPKVICCFGNVAVQSFFNDETVDVKSLRGDVHHMYGYPTIVAYHPLAIRRRPNLMSIFKEDWQLLENFYRQKFLQ